MSEGNRRQRPDVAAHRRFVEHKDNISGLSLEARFSYILENNLWGDPESVSGSGSSCDVTSALRLKLPPLLAGIGAKSMLDIPCGDFNWLSRVELDIDYTGADLVAGLVESNRKAYAGPRRRFVQLDLTSGELPRADVVLCRDCLVHLSYSNIARATENLRRSGSQWLLTTTFLDLEENEDIADGDWRPLNLTRPPFGFPAPEQVLLEECEEDGGAYRDKALGLWRICSIPVLDL